MDQNTFSSRGVETMASQEGSVILDAEVSRRLNLFNEIGRVVLSALDQAEIHKVAVDAIHFALGVRHVAIFQMDYQYSDIVLQAQTGEFVGLIPNRLRKRLNDGVLGTAARTGEIQVASVSQENLSQTLVGQPVKEIYV